MGVVVLPVRVQAIVFPIKVREFIVLEVGGHCVKKGWDDVL